MKKLIKTDVLLTPLHINTLLYNLLVGATPGMGLGPSLATCASLEGLRYLHSAGIWHRVPSSDGSPRSLGGILAESKLRI